MALAFFDTFRSAQKILEINEHCFLLILKQNEEGNKERVSSFSMFSSALITNKDTFLNGRYVFHNMQKQPSRGVQRKGWSENMQQMYRRTPMLKFDFNKVAKQHL